MSNPAKDKVCPDCGKIVRRRFADHVQKCKKKLEQKIVIQEEPPPTGIQDVKALEGMTQDSGEQLVNSETVVETDVEWMW